MTMAAEALEDELSIPVDYVPGARGHTVLAIGPDGDGAEDLAVWQLGPTGSAAGAWIIRVDEMRQDDHLHRVMRLLQDRCLVNWTNDESASLLGRLNHHLPADLMTAVQSNMLSIPDLLEEIADQRSYYAEAVEAHRATTKSKIAPLPWPTAVPDQAELAEWSLKAQPATVPPVGARVLALAAALARAAELWHDTEQVRYRRHYLRPLGEQQPLPPRWLARLRAAAGSSEPVPA